MGASSSTIQKPPNESESIEDQAASLGCLTTLRSLFSKLANPATSSVPVESVERCLGFKCKFEASECGESKSVKATLDALLEFVGAAIVELFFEASNEGITWVEFVKGYLRCCQRATATETLIALIRVHIIAARKAGLSLGFEAVYSGDVSYDRDYSNYKVEGFLEPSDVHMFLAMCWLMEWNSSDGNQSLHLPFLMHLVGSSVASCADEPFSSTPQIHAPKFLVWILGTLPFLGECFSSFVSSRVRSSSFLQNQTCTVSYTDDSKLLFGRGRAWAVSLTVRDPVRSQLKQILSSSDDLEECGNVLYSSSSHGRGISRLWANIEGYDGSLLMLVSASDENMKGERWVIGILTEKGLENKDCFYGNSGTLYAIHPTFHFYPASGREKNYVYSHLRPARNVYEAHPKAVGIGFGGSIGNERIFIDEEFNRITLRHHAVDKTYHPGCLCPNQGYLPVEGLISQVQVWGLGGQVSKTNLMSYKKREQLFIDQRRKVDLKTFGSWEDAPEKMMLDMIMDPNKVSKEDR